jgi:hypothetical protein
MAEGMPFDPDAGPLKVSDVAAIAVLYMVARLVYVGLESAG